MNPSSRSRLAGLSLAACAALVPLRSRAQDTAPVDVLATYVVSASRTPEDPALTPSTVTLLSLADLQAAQVGSLGSALGELPGVSVAESGATGGQTSVFLRGASSDQSLFVVDGVRLNTSTVTYYNLLGGANLDGLDRVEVLLGPQSTLYGSSAMGGVILLETARGDGPASGSIAAEAGSFATTAESITEQGSSGPLDYSGSLGRLDTDNDRAYNEYANWNYSGRLDGRISPSLLVGGTVRGQVGHYEEPGPITYPSPGDVQTVTDLATAYAEYDGRSGLKSRVTAAWYQDEYTWDKGTPDAYYARNTRDILEWQNTWEAATWAEVVGGLDYEGSGYDADGVTTDHSLAGYLSATLHPARALELTVGLRRDDFTTVGAATTGRVGAAYVLDGGATKLHATYGTGFNAPTPDERYGEPPYLLPNPGLRPERSRGWDYGVDQRFPGGGLTASATVFENKFRDLLEDEITNPITYAGQEVNVDSATTRGVEAGVAAKLTKRVSVRAGYTYLDAADDTTGGRLIERPRHVLDAGLECQITKDWLAGGGLHLVADRVDGAYAPEPLGGYTTARVYTSYALTRDVLLKLRVENLLNRSYQEVVGYPALPFAVYSGLEWRY
jgi:vitamin B12 transporter